MDNSEQKSNGNANRFASDPIEQANDDSGIFREQKKPADLVRRFERTANTAMPMPSNPFMGIQGPMPAILSFADIAESIARYKWTVLAVFILVAVPAIAAIWTQIIPAYQAKAEVRVRPIIPYLVFQTEESGKIPLYDSFVMTQVSIIQNQGVLRRVLDLPEIQQTQWYKNQPKSFAQQLLNNISDPIERLQDNLSVNPRKDTEIIDVTFNYSSAKETQLILNTILDQYIRYIREKSDATQDELYRQLADQYKSLENEILGRENVIAEIRKSLGTATPQELISNKRLHLDETESRLSTIQQDTVMIEWELARLTNEDSNDTQVSSDEKIVKQPAYYEDEEWRKRDSDVKVFEHRIAVSLLKPGHPDRSRMEKDLDFAKELLNQRQTQLDELWENGLKNTAEVPIVIADSRTLGYQEALMYLKHQLARSKHEEELLLAKLQQQQTEFNGLFENAQLLEKENNDQLHKRELFDAVRKRLDQKNMERNVPGSIEVLTRATIPTQLYDDQRIVLTLMAVIVALGTGGAIGLIRAKKSELICDPEDMPYSMQAPLLGSIPEIHNIERNNGQAATAMIESIRVVRTALLSRLNGHDSAAILVTSAVAGTGKSSFTLMLGKSLAQAGKKILIIDVDFHKMTLTRYFKNLSERSGFVQALRRRSVYKRHIFQTDTPGLSIVPAGKKANDEAVFDEIASGAVNTSIEKLRKQYDMILLDSPSILPLADATILSSQVDGTIMVERERVSQHKEELDALARLESSGGRLMGTVFVGSGRNGKYE